MRNAFAGICVKCGRIVPAYEGMLDKVGSKWEVSHLMKCPEKPKEK